MERPPTAQEAWNAIVDYAAEPDATVETAGKRSENSIRVDEDRGIVFQKDDGDERVVPRTEFNHIWRRFRSNGEITRQEVGDMTSNWAGAALFGAMNIIFDVELDKTGYSMRLRFESDESERSDL